MVPPEVLARPVTALLQVFWSLRFSSGGLLILLISSKESFQQLAVQRPVSAHRSVSFPREEQACCPRGGRGC